MKKLPGANITSYQIAELTNKPYLKALSAENLISAFRRTGIHPFNNKAIPDSEVAPFLIYKNASSEMSQESKDGNSTQERRTLKVASRIPQTEQSNRKKAANIKI